MLATGRGVIFAALVCLQLARGSITGQGSSRKILDTCGTANYGQCGGLNCPGPVKCADAAVGCCPSGFSCSRQSEWYWQCLPSNSSVTAVPVATPAPTPTPTLTPTPSSTLSAADASAALSNDCGGLVLSLHNQCGGESNCPTGVTCTDSQWPVGCCPAGSGCSRSNEFYWACLPAAASTSAGAFNTYDQCGGKSNCPAGASCSDQQWSTGVCVTGSQCTRATEWYWQCLPGGSGEAVAVLGPNDMQPWYRAPSCTTPSSDGSYMCTNYGISDTQAKWIWTTQGAAQTAPINNKVSVQFKKTFMSNRTSTIGLSVLVDDAAHITINGHDLGWTQDSWPASGGYFICSIDPGLNTITIDAFNFGGSAGLIVSGIGWYGEGTIVRSDASWTWQVGPPTITSVGPYLGHGVLPKPT